MITNPTDAAVARLEHDWQAWQCWVIRAWDGSRSHVTWHARRWSGEGDTLSADTAEELASRIAQAEAGG